MSLLEIESGHSISQVIWTCNMFTYGGITENEKLGIEIILKDLLHDVIEKQKDCDKENIRSMFSIVVSKLEKLLNQYPLEDGWIYEYGGLNCFFCEIMETLSFPVRKGKYYWISNFVYDEDFEEE